MGRGRVKTLLPRNFGDRSTLGEVEKIEPDAIWRVAVSHNATRTEFSHSLVDCRPSPATVERRQCIAHLTFKSG